MHRHRLTACLFLVASCGLPGVLFAAGSTDLFQTAALASSAAIVSSDAVNRECPISGKPVDADSPTRQIGGHTVAFCCGGCAKEWDAKGEAEKLQILGQYVPQSPRQEPPADARPAPAPPAPAAPVSGAAKVAREYLAACERADVGALDSLFLSAGNATVLENASDEGTWERYRDTHLMPELKEMSFKFTRETEAVQSFGTTSVVTHTGSFTVSDPNHPDVPRKILAAVTYVVVDAGGTPKIAHLHWSSRPENKASAAPPPGHTSEKATPKHAPSGG